MYLKCTMELVWVGEERSLNDVEMFKKQKWGKNRHLTRPMANLKIVKVIKEKDTLRRQEATDSLLNIRWSKQNYIQYYTLHMKLLRKNDSKRRTCFLSPKNWSLCRKFLTLSCGSTQSFFETEKPCQIGVILPKF